MRGGGITAALLLALLAGCAHARRLQDSATAVSVAGGQGPYGNCGYTSTTGDAAAYASGPPCGAVVTPAPPPTATCPATTVTVDWKLPPAGAGYRNLTLCPGSTVSFKWNTGSANVTYGLYQVPNTTCPIDATSKDIKLIITPASSPNAAGVVSATLNAPGAYSFADLKNCPAGQIQTVVISSTPVPTPVSTPSSTASSTATSTAG